MTSTDHSRGLRLRPLDLVIFVALMGVTLTLAQWSYASPRQAAFTSESIPVVPPATFHPVERFADGGKLFRWSYATTLIRPPNPGGHATLQLLMAGGPGRSAPVVLEHRLWALTVFVRPEPRIYHVLALRTPHERVGVTVRAPAIYPQGRELGVVIGDVVVMGGGAVPGHVVVFALLGAVAGGLYLRWRGWGPAMAAAVVALGLALLLWYQSRAGWRDGAFGLMLLVAAQGVFILEIARRATTRALRPLLAATIALPLNALFFTLVYSLVPEHEYLLFSEDHIVENATALCFALTFLVGLARIIRAKNARERGYLLIPALGLGGFLDEISFGERIFGFASPLLYGYKIDAFHDLPTFVIHMALDYNPVLTVLAGIVLLLLALVAVVIVWRGSAGGFMVLIRTPAFRLIVVAFVFLIFPLALDVQTETTPFIDAIFEETFELNAALALLFGAIAIEATAPDAIQARWPVEAVS